MFKQGLQQEAHGRPQQWGAACSVSLCVNVPHRNLCCMGRQALTCGTLLLRCDNGLAVCGMGL